MRLSRPLNHLWKSSPRPNPAFTEADFDDTGWEAVRLPHTNLELPADNFDPASFRFTTGYRRELTFEPTWKDHRVFLVFEAAMARAEVWIDGIRTGAHRGGYTPFEVEVPAEAVVRGRAVLAVASDADEDPQTPPFGLVVDYLTYGGLYREVHLEVRPNTYLAGLTVETPGGPLPRVRGVVEFSAPPPAGTTAEVRVSGPGDQVLARGEVRWDGAAVASYDLPVAEAQAWDLENPCLYTLTVGTETDQLVRTIGFRQAEFRPDGFFLNGRRLKLRGLNRHQCWPHAGYALPRRAQAADADLVKTTLGCNIVRSSHYPPSRHFLDRCDQIGLLVFEEIPGWQHIGGPEWKEAALQSVAAMVVRDRHRPSVVLWGVRINESADDDGFYRQTNDLARRLDPSRPTGGVRNFAGSHLLEDVYTYNDFSHDGTNRGLSSRRWIARRPVPYLVTEHNGHMFPTKKADPETRRVEHALRHARVQSAAASDPEVAGALGWCLADYNTHADFGSGDQVCHHGVVDQYRCAKPAADFYASQRPGPPFGRVASRMAVGDHDAAVQRHLWVFTNSSEVRVSLGGRSVGTFFPDHRGFPGLPHPPVKVDDLIGSSVEDEPGLTPSQAAVVKAFFQAYRRTGRIPLGETLPMVMLMVGKRWWFPQIYDLYTRHVAGWGRTARLWRFEGWTDGVKEWEQELGPAHAARLVLTLDTEFLEETDTWDTARAEVRLTDNHGNEVWYGAEPVTLSVEGPLRVIGPVTRPLTGGSTAFWLATTGQSGRAVVRARTDRFSAGPAEVEIRVPSAPAG